MNRIEQLRGFIAARETERAALADQAAAVVAPATTEARSLNPDENKALEAINARAAEIDAANAADRDELDKLVRIDEARRTAPNFIPPREQVTPADIRSLSVSQLRDAAKRAVDEQRGMDTARGDQLDKMLRSDGRFFRSADIAKDIILTENDAYRSAFIKGITQAQPLWSPEEVRALQEYRAQKSGTNTSGGFGVPVFIDPTIIITTSTLASPIIGISRVEMMTSGNSWKGVSGAAASWSFDAESAAVSDDTVTLAQPSVSVHMARGFIPFSIEFEDDYPNAAGELGRLLESGYMDLLAAKLASGSGTNEPWGIEDALDANTNVEVVVTTDGAFGAVDIDKVWAALGERWRQRATWLAHVDVENEIRGFGSGTATSRFTVDQTAGGISRLNGRPFLTNDYLPQFTGVTTAANILIVGDFSNYLIAQRVGMTVELVPHLVDVTNNQPTGERGWFAYARVGADSINDTAFRLLQNQ